MRQSPDRPRLAVPFILSFRVRNEMGIRRPRREKKGRRDNNLLNCID